MSDHIALNQTYNERNTLMIALARTMLLLGHKAGYGIDLAKAALGWGEDWSTVVYIDLPDGCQLSYHMNNGTAAAARTLPLYPGKWDGTWLGREAPDWLIHMRDVSLQKGGADSRTAFEQLAKSFGIYTCNYERWTDAQIEVRRKHSHQAMAGDYVSEVLQDCWNIYRATAPSIPAAMGIAKDFAAQTEYIKHLEAGLRDNGCEIATDTDGNVWVRNLRAEHAELATPSAPPAVAPQEKPGRTDAEIVAQTEALAAAFADHDWLENDCAAHDKRLRALLGDDIKPLDLSNTEYIANRGEQ